jgi:alpha-glucosidase
MLLLTLRGTPTLYYGDELGMEQVPIPLERVQDPFERNVPGLGLGRDGGRTPMQWSAAPNAGFSDTEPWLPLEAAYAARNVAALSADKASILQLYRRLLALRRKHRALNAGSYRPLVASGDLLLFVRQCDEERLLVALNLGAEPTRVTLGRGHLAGTLLLSTFCQRHCERVRQNIDLQGNEGVIVELAGDAVLP